MLRPQDSSEKYELEAYVGGEIIDIEGDIGKRKYTGEEAKSELKKLSDNMNELILGNNKSLNEVREKLNLITEDKTTGARLEWSTDNYDICTYDGYINNEEFDNGESVNVTLYCIMTLGDEELAGTYNIKVVSPLMNEELSNKKRIQDEIQKNDMAAANEDKVDLPGVVDGKHVEYINKQNGKSPVLIVILGFAASAFLIAKEYQDKRNYEKNRKYELTADYPSITTKLYLLIYAGGTIISSFEHIVREYDNNIKRGHMKPRAAYEQMKKCLNNINNGMGEAKSYIKWGNDCGINEYKRLGSYLSEYLKKGTGDLKKKLRQLSSESMETAAANAKERGEKAGSKLVVPMIAMLFTVMVIVIVPAFDSFSV
ncbi:hypothetical protein JCM13267_02200 [Howardella ureilytica]